MSIVDCSCRGNNPDCERCFGRGYFDSDNLKEKIISYSTQKSIIEETKEKISFKEKVNILPPEKIVGLLNHIIKTIDFKSKIQASILKSTPFHSKRKGYIIRKIKDLNSLELYKKDLKEKLQIVIKRAHYMNIQIKEVEFIHLLSKMDVQSWSDISVIDKIKNSL